MKTHPNIVNADSADVKTTQLPASAASAPICCAIAYEATAHGVAKMAMSVTN